MQPTANIWETLCRDFETRRQSASSDQYREIAEAFLTSARQVLRANSPRLCDAIEIAGDVYQGAGHGKEAAQNYEEALAKAQDVGAGPSVARLAAKLAFLYDQQEELEKSHEMYLLALKTYEKVYDHSQHAQLLNSLAALHKRRGDFDAAMKAYQRAIDTASRVHGDAHPEVATATNNLGVAYTDAGDYVRAENLQLQALALREKCYGAMHPDVAQSLANLAVVYHCMGERQKAEAFYRSALDIYRRFRPDSDPEVKGVIDNLDALLALPEEA